METRVSMMFYGKKTGMNEGKSLPIYMRVTIQGQRFEVSTNRYVEPSMWSTKAGKVKGNSEDARSINNRLDVLKLRVYGYQKIVMREGNVFIKETLRNKWYGIGEKMYSLIEVFKTHNGNWKN